MNRGLPTECKTSFSELISKHPRDEEGSSKVFTWKYEGAYFECDNILMKIKGIKFEYDVRFSHEKQHFDAMNMAKAVVNSVITGESLLINIRNMVSDFGSKNHLILN